MAKSKVGLDKDYGLVYGHESGAKYEQDGKLFDGSGNLIQSGEQPKGADAPEQEGSQALDDLKAKAKELGIKSPHLFKPEALALKVEEAELAALSAGNAE